MRRLAEEGTQPLRDIVAGSKAIIIVNVASIWGLTDAHYRKYTEMYDAHRARGLTVVAVPCNQFAEEEPWPEQ